MIKNFKHLKCAHVMPVLGCAVCICTRERIMKKTHYYGKVHPQSIREQEGEAWLKSHSTPHPEMVSKYTYAYVMERKVGASEALGAPYKSSLTFEQAVTVEHRKAVSKLVFKYLAVLIMGFLAYLAVR